MSCGQTADVDLDGAVDMRATFVTHVDDSRRERRCVRNVVQGGGSTRKDWWLRVLKGGV